MFLRLRLLFCALNGLLRIRLRLSTRIQSTRATYLLATATTAGAARTTGPATAPRSVTGRKRSIIRERTLSTVTAANDTTRTYVARLIMANALILITRRLVNFNYLLRFLFNLLIAQVTIKIVLSNRLLVYLLCLVNQNILLSTGRLMMISFFRHIICIIVILPQL